MWVCATCETLNPFSSGSCQICGAQKPVTEQPAAAKPAPAPAPAPAAPAPSYASPSAPAPAPYSGSRTEPSAETMAAMRKQKSLRKGLIIANVALLAVNIIGIIMIAR